MKKCSFCGKDNHDDAKFCANCGRTFVIKEMRKRLGQSFEILAYIAIGLGIFSFIFDLVDIIINNGLFFTYVIWLIEYLIFGLIGLTFLYAQQVKSYTLSLFTTLSLLVHNLIFFRAFVYRQVFLGFSQAFYIFFLLLITALAIGFVFHHLKNPLAERILKYYRFVVGGIVAIYTFIALIYFFVCAFTSINITFELLSILFYFAALSVLFTLAVIDKTIDVVERQGEREDYQDAEIVDEVK